MKTNKAPSIDHICLIRLSALGDCCHALAVIQNIQKQSPHSRITWVIGKTEHQLFRDLEGIEFIVVDKKNLFSSFLKIRKELRKKQFDVLLNMHASMSANLISLAINAKKKIGYDQARARDLQNWFCNESILSTKNQHVLDGMLEFSAHINVNCEQPCWNPLTLKPEEDFAIELIDPNKYTCVISPCSSQPYGDKYFRSWPINNYIELIRYLLNRNDLQLILTGGMSPTEKSYSEQLDISFNKRILNLMGKTSIREMAALIKHSDIIISPDSGPAHIATIMGTPVIGLYAMTNPQRSGPYNSTEWLINKYPEALKIYMDKLPEEVKWGQKIQEPDAMNLITSNDVIEKIKQLIDKK